MALRVTLSTLLSTTSLTGGVRVSGHFLATTIPLAGPKRLSIHLLNTSAAYAGPKRVSAHYVQTAISVHNRIELLLLESDSEIYGVANYEYELSSPPWPEHNPYRPRIPEQFIDIGEDFHGFFEENQQILREQHNLTQAGDTTFPYQLMMKSHDKQLYKLGSISRFYHEDFGVFLARYVQFGSMVDVEVAHCPVGLKRLNKSLEWVVTNDYSQSSPNLVVGIIAAFDLPADDTFGWVIVDGPILQQVKNNSTTAAIGESLVWDSSGSVSNSAEGKVLGRRVNRLDEAGNAAKLMAGQMWVRTESFSEASLTALISSNIVGLQNAITELQNQVGQLPAAAELAAINTALTALTAQVNLEISQRKAADVAIQEALANLDFVTTTQLDTAVANAQNTLTALIDDLTTQLNAVKAIALEALDKANSMPSITEIQNQISLILTMISELNLKPKNKFPVVDGSVPPNLVYLDDGSLVYVESA